MAEEDRVGDGLRPEELSYESEAVAGEVVRVDVDMLLCHSQDVPEPVEDVLTERVSAQEVECLGSELKGGEFENGLRGFLQTAVV